MNPIVSSDDIPTLATNTETALARGRMLMDWWSKCAEDVTTFRIPLHDRNLVEIKGFFDTIENESKTTAVMGCLQTARFSMPEDATFTDMPFDVFFKTQFATRARSVHPDGRASGFGYQVLLRKRKASDQIQTPEDESSATVDFTLVDSIYDWLLMRVELYDFLLAMPMGFLVQRCARRLKSIAYVVAHQMFSEKVGATPPGTIGECRFGYSFLPCACVRGPFGFGPGHFGSAIKLFRFSLLSEDVLEIQLSFIVAPRSTKVLSLWRFDPIYSLVHAAHAMTLGVLPLKRLAHDALDKKFIALHGIVHHNLLNGMEDVWTQHHWRPEVK